MTDDTRWDGVFMNVIQQKVGIDGRSTDFFTDQKKAEGVIIEACKSQFLIYEKDNKLKKEKELEKKKKDEQKKAELDLKKQEELIKKQKQEEEKKKSQTPVVEPVKTVVVQPTDTASTNESVSEVKVEETKTEGDDKKKEEEDKTPPPLGNGGKTDLYIWTQTLEELHMYIFLEDDVTKKSLKVDIQPKKLFVSVKGKTLIDGEWSEQINCDGTIWTIEDGEIQDYHGLSLHISLEKWKNQWHWWDTPVKSHAKINTQKIQPENSNLSDLDGETKSTVEKMMFDMRQKQMGKPSSDEIMKQDKLKDFMSAHPEMDFSKCKFG